MAAIFGWRHAVVIVPNVEIIRNDMHSKYSQFLSNMFAVAGLIDHAKDRCCITSVIVGKISQGGWILSPPNQILADRTFTVVVANADITYLTGAYRNKMPPFTSSDRLLWSTSLIALTRPSLQPSSPIPCMPSLRQLRKQTSAWCSKYVFFHHVSKKRDETLTPIHTPPTPR